MINKLQKVLDIYTYDFEIEVKMCTEDLKSMMESIKGCYDKATFNCAVSSIDNEPF